MTIDKNMQSMASWWDSENRRFSILQESFPGVNINAANGNRIYKILSQIMEIKQDFRGILLLFIKEWKECFEITKLNKDRWCKLKWGIAIHYLLCCVPQIVSRISSCIYLLQQPDHRERTVNIRSCLFIVCLPRESSMHGNKNHLLPWNLGTNLLQKFV